MPELRMALTNIGPNNILTPAFAAHVIGGLGEAGAQALPELIQLLTPDTLGTIQLAAIGAIDRIGPSGTNALPYLVPLMDSDLMPARSQSIRVIGNLVSSGPIDPHILEKLRLAVNDPALEVRNTADAVLKRITRNGRP